MSDTPKFEVIDRRKFKAEEEERAAAQTHAPETSDAPSSPAPGPRLVTEEPKPVQPEPESAPELELEDDEIAGDMRMTDMPPAPTADEIREQRMAYDTAAQRLEDLVRAQNPAAGPQPPVTFDHLVQQLYVSAMIQMGAGTQEGQRPRVDILGAKQTIDLLSILAERSKGNLSAEEERTLNTVLFEARMAFLELTNMITLQGVPAPPPHGSKR